MLVLWNWIFDQWYFIFRVENRPYHDQGDGSKMINLITMIQITGKLEYQERENKTTPQISSDVDFLGNIVYS